MLMPPRGAQIWGNSEGQWQWEIFRVDRTWDRSLEQCTLSCIFLISKNGQVVTRRLWPKANPGRGLRRAPLEN